MLKRMLVSPWCTATFAFALSLQVPPLLGVHRSCWERVGEAGAGSEPSGKGMLLVEAGVRVAGSGVAPVRAVGSSWWKCQLKCRAVWDTVLESFSPAVPRGRQ